MKINPKKDGLEDLPGGYKNSAFVGTDAPLSHADLEDGFCSYGGLDLDDMFGAFTRTKNYGLAGGDRTVDDYTPEGLETHAGGVRDGADDNDEDDNPSARYP